MQHLRIIAVVIILATIAGCAQQRGPRSDDHYGTFRGRWWNYYDRGVWHLANQRYADAKEDFDQALAGRTRDAWSARTYGLHFQEFFPNRELGITLYHEGDLDTAEQYLLESVEQGAESARAWYYIDKIKRDRIAQGLVEDTADPSVAATFGEGEFLTELDVPVSLSVSDDNGVTDVVVEGERLYQRKSETSGNFDTKIRMEEGEHTVTVEVADLADKSKTESYTVRIDTTAPTIAFQGFTPGIVVNESTYTIRGVAMDKHGVTGISLGDDSTSASGGTSEPFEYTVNLAAGENIFSISAVDAAGNENKAAVAIYQGDANSAAAKLWWLNRRAPERLNVAMAGGPAFLAAVLESAYAQTDAIAIEISFPETPNDPAYRRNLLPIDGRVVSKNGISEIKVAGVSVLPADAAVLDGEVTYEFKRRVPLDPGENNIELDATDKAAVAARENLPVLADFPLVDDPETFMPIAVTNVVMQNAAGEYERNEALLTNLELILQDRFQVVDRSQIDAVLQEQAISAQDLASEDTRIDLGEIVASQFLLTGEVHRFQDSADQLVVKLTNTETATLVAFDAVLENTDDVNSIKRSTKDIRDQIADYFPRVTGQVKQARGKTMIADYSADIGVKPGAFILILKVIEEAFVDEDTGEVLMPATYGTAGRAKIARVQGANTMADVQQLEEGFALEANIPTITW